MAPAIDDGFVAALKARRMRVVAEVEGFDAGRALLADGTALRPDVVICATGYRTGLEPMLGHLGVLDARGVPRLHGAEQDRGHPGLWFTGMRPRLSGFFRAAGLTGREIALGIASDLAPPATSTAGPAGTPAISGSTGG